MTYLTTLSLEDLLLVAFNIAVGAEECEPVVAELSRRFDVLTTERDEAQSEWKRWVAFDAASVARAEAAEARVAELTRGGDPDYSPDFQDEYQRLWHVSQARVGVLEEALRKHWRHDDECEQGVYGPISPCTCGLTAALASVPAQEEPRFGLRSEISAELIAMERCPHCGRPAQEGEQR